MKEMRILFAYLMAMSMLMMCPQQVWAQDESVTPESCSHEYANGYCSHCGAYEPAVLVTEDNLTELNLTSSYKGYYAVGNAGQLAWVADKVNNDNANYKSKNVVLTADIDLGDHPGNWTPIGKDDTHPYTGMFHGQQHKISNMKILNFTTGYQGLFGYIKGASVEEFALSGTMTSSTEGVGHVGSVVASAASSSVIISARSSVNITIAKGVKHSHVGGIVGSCSATTVRYCINEGCIDAGATSDCVAGVAGYVTSTAKVESCLNAGRVTSTTGGAYIAGIVGYENASSFYGIHNSLNVGPINGGSANSNAGAIYGRFRSNCRNAGSDNYYLDTSATKGVGGNDPSYNFDGIIKPVSAEQLASGEICFAMNGTFTLWCQHLGVDAYPTPFYSEYVVRYVEHLNCAGEAIGMAYSNSYQPVKDRHTLNDLGLCVDCGKDAGAKAVFTEDGLLTFYCDNLTHEGTTYNLEEGFAVRDLKSAPWDRHAKSVTKAVFDKSFAIARPTTCYMWFAHCENMTEIEGFEYLNTENVTSMNYMFYSCFSLTSLDLSHFDTHNVKDMSGMFNFAYSYYTSPRPKLKSLDLSNFDTSSLENMSAMFYGFPTLEYLDISNFDTRNVRSMSYLFSNSINLRTIKLGNFDMRNVTDTYLMPTTTDGFGKQESLKELIMTSMPYMKDGTFNKTFAGDGVTVRYELDDNSVIYDGETNYLPAPTVAPTYTRHRIKNLWSTIVVPFDMASSDDFDLYTLSGTTADELTLTKVDGTLAAGTPALVCLKGDAAAARTYTFPAADAAISTAGDLTGAAADGLTLTGSYGVQDISGEAGYVFANNAFWNSAEVKGESSVYCTPFRAYLAGAGTVKKLKLQNVSAEELAADDVQSLADFIFGGECTVETQRLYDSNADGELSIGDLTYAIKVLTTGCSVQPSRFAIGGESYVGLKSE